MESTIFIKVQHIGRENSPFSCQAFFAPIFLKYFAIEEKVKHSWRKILTEPFDECILSCIYIYIYISIEGLSLPPPNQPTLASWVEDVPKLVQGMFTLILD